MRSGIYSETAYGFGVLWELCHRQEFVGVPPAMPSTYAEGRGGGYDACIGRPGFALFLQFKLSEYLQGGRAKEWPCHQSPYYRFPVYSRLRSQQHKLLRALATSNPKRVYYVAPAFHEQEWFCAHYEGGHVVEHSFFCPLEKTRALTDDGDHCITFTHAHPPDPHWHSLEPGERIEGLMGDEFLSGLVRDVTLAGERLTRDYFLGIGSQISRASGQLPQANSRFSSLPLPDLVERLAMASETVLGATMVLVARRETDGHAD